MRNRSIHAKLLAIVLVFVIGFAIQSLIAHSTTHDALERSDFANELHASLVLSKLSPPGLLLQEAPLLLSELALTH